MALIFDVPANQSYLTHRNRERLSADANAYFGALGLKLWSSNPYVANPDAIQFAFRALNEGTPQEVEQDVTQADCDAFMAQHDNSVQTASQLHQARLEVASVSLDTLFDGLNALSADDAAYAAMGRAMARKDGATPVQIAGIVDRTTARTYLQGKAEWVALPLAAKNWLADQLDMEALLFQVLILVLRK